MNRLFLNDGLFAVDHIIIIFFPHSIFYHLGDVMIIPENWGHGVLNLEDSIAMASELRKGHWRLSPGPSSIGKLPFDNRNV